MPDGFKSLFEDFLVAPHWYPVIPIIGFLIIAAASVGASSSEDEWREGSSAGAWPAPAALSLIVIAVAGILGKYAGDLVTLIVYTVVAVICGIAAGNRGIVRSWVAEGGVVPMLIRDIVLLIVAIVGTVIALEASWNTKFPLINPLSLAIEICLVTGIILALYFLGQRSGAIVWPAVLLAGFAGICQYFLARFKGVAILPSDLLAMPTALRVKEGYSFVFDGRCLWGPLAATIALCALSMLGNLPDDEPKQVEIPRGRHSAQFVTLPAEDDPKVKWNKVLKVVINLLIGVGCAAAVAAAMVFPKYIHGLGLKFDYSDTLGSYKNNGFLTSFVAVAQDLPISAPAGYSRAKATELQTTLDERYEQELGSKESRAQAVAQFEAEKPSIVVVMNESFADLSVYDKLHCGYEGPTYFKSIGDGLLRGNLTVSVIGGGTCNTEFEFLTGNNYAFVGGGKYPFITYSMKVESLPSQLAALGYSTHAIHPNDPTNWKRDEAYKELGFDEFIDISSFEEAPQLHMGATDASTYEKIIDILKVDPSPQFIFDVTMQNHGSYNLDNIPDDKKVNYQPEGVVEVEAAEEAAKEDPEALAVTTEDAAALNEYLACIQASDSDLKWLIEQLKGLDRKVVLVFFGDHQPPFSPLYNDLYCADDLDTLPHTERVYQSSYIIWANYDVAGAEQKSDPAMMSADTLGALTFNLIGAPLSSYQQARLTLQQEVRAINSFGYLGADDTWYAPDDAESPYAESYQSFAQLNHLNFGSRVV